MASSAVAASPGASSGGGRSQRRRGTARSASHGSLASASAAGRRRSAGSSAARSVADLSGFEAKPPAGFEAGEEMAPEVGPGDHSLGYKGSQPHYKSTYWDLGRGKTLDPPLKHRPPSEWGTPHKHHFLSMPVYPPRVFQGQRTMRADGPERHTTLRPPVPEPKQTLRTIAGEFGANHTIIRRGTAKNPVNVLVGEDRGQPLSEVPPIEVEGDMSLGFKGMEPHLASTQSQLGRQGFTNPEWGVPDKHHFLSMPCFPKLMHKTNIPDKPKKIEGDMSRGFESSRPHMWTTHWELGNDVNFKHTRKRYDFAPVAESQYRFTVAREGFPGSSY
eukprot:TRINITY_DN71871_c0_g1_i1.p1 TRINITY_DN71871_c0_g1~~TRINITY_DN71871_c0_g1_i1.p1  ORF type:complete len:331 (+),score=32.96 TRINITY_DN71871_c0_g1_i1:130-1122(+)